MLNRVQLIGRLGADPELRYTPNGVPVATMRLAVERDFKGEDGQKPVDWIQIVAWRQQAEYAANYLNKGRLVAIAGRLQVRQWTTQEGQKRTTVEVVADAVYGLERQKDAGGADEGTMPDAGAGYDD